MKKTRRLAALLLALLLTAAFAGCGKNEPRTDYTTEGPPATVLSDESQTAVEPSAQSGKVGFTFEDLTRENAVSTLVSAYRDLQLLRYENGALYAETYYFVRGGETVWTRRIVDPDLGESFSCCVGGVVYQKDGDHLQFSRYLEEDADTGEDYSMEYDVCGQLLYGTVESIESAGEDLWRFEIRDMEYSPEIVCRCTATKQTLTLKTIEWDYGDGNTSVIELHCGDAVQTKDFGLLEGFDKPFRTVKCVCALHDETGKATAATYTVDAPYNAEPLFVHARGLNLYLDKDFTKEYVYPGNGVGYTVYATDAMG